MVRGGKLVGDGVHVVILTVVCWCNDMDNFAGIVVVCFAWCTRVTLGTQVIGFGGFLCSHT